MSLSTVPFTHITVAVRNSSIFIFKLVLTADLYVPDHPTRKRRNSRAENSREVDFEKIQCRAK